MCKAAEVNCFELNSVRTLCKGNKLIKFSRFSTDIVCYTNLLCYSNECQFVCFVQCVQRNRNDLYCTDVLQFRSLCTRHVFTDLTCGPFPGPGSSSERRVSANPMHEFIHHDDRHVEDAFQRFKKAHNKNYNNMATHEKRKHAFRHNLRLVVLCCITVSALYL